MSNLNQGVLDGVRRIGSRVRDLVVDGGLPGVPLGFRLRGATKLGPPVTGTWGAGDMVPDRGGNIWTCTAAGTPGTWVPLAPGLRLIYADQLPGVDPTGATDSSAAIRAKQTALGAASYVLVFGAGTYLFNSAFLNLGLNQYIQGQGQFITSFNWSVAGPLITVVEPGAFNGSHRAGRLSGFSIIGPQGSSNTAGIKYANLQSIQVDDVGFFGLDGGAVIGYFPGGTGWAEEAVMTRITSSECGATSGYVFGFTGTSFDYSYINAVVVAEANVDIISLGSGAQLQGLDLSLRGNVHGGTSNSGAIVAIDRGNTSGTSYLTNAKFAVSMENDTGAGTVGHYLLWMGSNNAASQFSAQGVFNLINAGVAPQGTHNPGNASFNGITLTTSGASLTAGYAGGFQGGYVITEAGALSTNLFAGNIYWQAGTATAALLPNGNTALTFNGVPPATPSTQGIQTVLALKQPASGAAGTVTWPANCKFAGGANTLSATNGATDLIFFTYLPSENIFYGVINKAYA